MILKSFEIENNIKRINNYKFILIYGENIGLKEALKEKIINLNNKADVINLYQEDITKTKGILLSEVKNISLFSEEKIIIINQANEKLFTEIEELLNSEEKIKVILIGDLFDKKSKLRNLFEKNKHLAIVPCYNDTDLTLRKLIQNKLIGFKNLNSHTINLILNHSNLNRKTILNNIEKINTFFDNKILEEYSLEVLLNSDRNEIFENIRDAALLGDKTKLNSLFGYFSFSNEDTFLYLNMINYRLTKLLDIHKQNAIIQNIDETINKIRPPIFWKDKPVYKNLLKRWDKTRVLDALRYLGKIEKELKNSSGLNNLAMIKNSITNICANSWSYF